MKVLWVSLVLFLCCFSYQSNSQLLEEGSTTTTEIESQGGVAKDSKSFQKATLDIAQKELNLRKASAKRDGITKAGQEEIDKEQQRINKERGNTFKGILGGIKGLGASLEKVVFSFAHEEKGSKK